MAENKQYVYKNRKYAFQFPEETSSEDQAKYLKAVKDSFEKDDIITIDPKIKVFPHDYQEEVITDVKKTNTEDTKTNVAGSEEKTKEDIKSTEGTTTPPKEGIKEPTETEKPIEKPEEKSSDEITVTKVETTPKEVDPGNVLIGEKNE